MIDPYAANPGHHRKIYRSEFFPMPFQPFSRSRKSNLALTLLVVLLLLFGLTLVDAAWRSQTVDHAANRALVRELGLTDLSLFTEARYTRHPSQADRHVPFQDHPAALEHFPTGSLLTPPFTRPESSSAPPN